MKRPVLTISGHHGSGKSTAAKYLAQHYGLRYISAGHFFRELAQEKGYTLEEFSKLAEQDPQIDRLVDEKTREEAKKGGVILDGQLAAHITGDLATVRIFITAPFETRVRRIMQREHRSYEDVAHETRIREEIEVARFKELYGFNVYDISLFDFVLNTDRFSIEETRHILIQAINAILSVKGYPTPQPPQLQNAQLS